MHYCGHYVNCQGIGTDVPDRSADVAQPDGFYEGNVDQGLKGRPEAVNASPQNQPVQQRQMNIGAGNHPFPKSFLDGDFEFVSSSSRPLRVFCSYNYRLLFVNKTVKVLNYVLLGCLIWLSSA